MNSGEKRNNLLDVDYCLSAFICRVNDAYVMTHTIHDLVNDTEYRKLTIKNGKLAGTPLGSHHFLPGYWFTVFVATHESFQRVIYAVESLNEEELKIEESDNEEFKEVVERIKHLEGLIEMKRLIKKFQTDLDEVVLSLGEIEKGCIDTFPNKKPLKRLVQSIASGNYEFNDENDLSCTFIDIDPLCDYRFEFTINLGEFTQFSINFSKHLTELLRPIIEARKTIRSKVSKLLIGDIYKEDL